MGKILSLREAINLIWETVEIGREMESGCPYAYSCAMKSHFRKFGNQMSGSGNHLCEFTRAVFYLDHTPPAWTCHAQHQYL